MKTLLLINALFLSTIAAFYAITGLIAIFATAVIPIAIMGTALETAKLVIASWLYRRWNDITKVMRYYFSVSLVVLMFLTSMGIFGFLSKAHLDQAVPSGEVSSKVYILDDKIKYQRDIVSRNQKTIKQLDDLVEQSIGRTNDEKGINAATELRRKQEGQRNKLVSEIEKAQNTINNLNNERAPIAGQLRKIEAEVGPIKYIAALIYGDKIDENLLEKAVRFVIIIIVLVFDPLAVMMLIAWNREIVFTSGVKPQDPTPTTPLTILPTIKPLTEVKEIVKDIKTEIKSKLKETLNKVKEKITDGNSYLERKRKERANDLSNINTNKTPTAFYEIDNVDVYERKSDIKETITRPLDGRPEEPKNSVIPKKE
jgi:hypothetical protein